MDLDERFQKLTPARQLAVAAAAARRVLPIFASMCEDDVTPLRDGIDIVELAARGQTFSAVDYTRAINDITAVASADPDRAEHAVSTAVVAALEAASHNRPAALDSLAAARLAPEFFAGADEAKDQLHWQVWATSRAETAATTAPLLSGADAPATRWQAKLQDNLPLFEQTRDA